MQCQNYRRDPKDIWAPFMKCKDEASVEVRLATNEQGFCSDPQFVRQVCYFCSAVFHDINYTKQAMLVEALP